MQSETPESYVDSKGRLRWHANDRLAELLKQLHAFLVVAGYDASHAARYPQLAHAISRHPEPIEQLYRRGQLRTLPGVGPVIAGLLGELITTGTCSKLEEWSQAAPLSLLELIAIPGLGPRTVRQLWRDHGIQDLEDLRAAADSGRLAKVAGIGPKTLAVIRQYLDSRQQSPRDRQQGRQPE